MLRSAPQAYKTIMVASGEEQSLTKMSSTNNRRRTETVVTFRDFTDLQTRLVLLPRVEEEGIGAVVASYDECFVDTTTTTTTAPAAPPPAMEVDNPFDDPRGGDAERTSKKEATASAAVRDDTSLDGWLLTGMLREDDNNCCGDEGDATWNDVEFSDILASIRQAAPPLRLTFEAPASEPQSTTTTTADPSNEKACSGGDFPFEEEKKMEEEPTSDAALVVPRSETMATSTTNDGDSKRPAAEAEHQPSLLANEGDDEEEQEEDTAPQEPNGTVASPAQGAEDEAEAAATTTTSSNTTTMKKPALSSPSSPSSFNLSSWTSRVSAAAAAASNGAAAMARAANERARQVAAERAAAAGNNAAAATTKTTEFQIFVQSPTGAFLPDNSSNNANNPITNASLLVVRRSATEAVDAAVYSFQWFRSTGSTSNTTSSGEGWDVLPGATTAALQPSATEVGYRLRCAVTPKQQQQVNDDNDDNSDRAGRDNNHGDESLMTAVIICETTQTVTAALSLLNGARQALVRGAQFGNLHGRGVAEGRVFSVTIQVGKRGGGRRSKVCAAVTFYQVAGGAAEPVHDAQHPLVGVTAGSDYGHGKNLEFLFASLPPDSMLAALCSATCDGGSNNTIYKFQLQAPNRMARESILLALGVANYRGQPSELDASVILYHHHHRLEDEDASSLSCDESVRSSSSVDTATSGHEGSNSRSGLSSMDRPPLPAQHQQQQRRTSASSATSSLHERCLSGDSSSAADQVYFDSETVASQELEIELERLRAKLARKDKVVSELQRQITFSDDQLRKTEHQLQCREAELQQSHTNRQATQQALSEAEEKIQRVEAAKQREVEDWQRRSEILESELQVQTKMIAALEKAKRTLQNEKDVLTAAVEARDSKLAKMSNLQASLNEASAQLEEKVEFQKELDEANKRLTDAQTEVKRIRQSETTCQENLKKAQTQIKTLEKQLQLEKTKTASHQSELEKEQMKIQKLKAERNSYKQKGDSLAKEMARVCRHGRTVREVEKILADDVTRRQEVELLREQKRTAVEEMENFRTAYEQSLSVQKMAGIDHDSGKLLERNAELERLLSELTEYLNAKEMQLETMKQVNDALQSEIRGLARANMSDHDI